MVSGFSAMQYLQELWPGCPLTIATILLLGMHTTMLVIIGLHYFSIFRCFESYWYYRVCCGGCYSFRCPLRHLGSAYWILFCRIRSRGILCLLCKLARSSSPGYERIRINFLGIFECYAWNYWFRNQCQFCRTTEEGSILLQEC